jgi:hypothetical protein
MTELILSMTGWDIVGACVLLAVLAAPLVWWFSPPMYFYLPLKVARKNRGRDNDR